MLESLRDALLDAAALLVPVECAGCGAPDRPLCDRCTPWLLPAVTRHDLRDGTPVYSALEYEGVVRAVVLALKEQSRPGLARALAPALAAAVGAAGGGHLLVPVTSSPAALRRRGFDPVLELARAARLRTRPALRSSATGAQKALGLEARAGSRAGTMRATAGLAGERVVLLDDVLTTGATLLEAARAVREAGGLVVAGATVAHTRRRHGESSVTAR